MDADNGLHDELAARLGELDGVVSGDACRVERVLKESPSEVTQLVWLRLDGGGELGPLVQKVVTTSAGAGSAWRLLAKAQGEGLRSANLPRVLSCKQLGDRLHVLMEYVPGPTLSELVARTPPSDRPALAALVLPQLCDAATTLHERLGTPVIHRDITPSNVICSGLQQETAVLVDLGIARAWRSGAESDTTHFGTRAYAAPEQYGFGQTDARSDVYALGLVAFFCLTGHDPSPKDREDGFAAEGVPEPWRQVIACAAAFDPDERFATARELGEAIAGLGAGGERGVDAQVVARRGFRELSLRIWRERNVVVLPVVAALVAVCISCAFDPRTYADGSVAFNMFGYLVYMNYIVLAIGYLAMDKRWLRSHVRRLRGRTFWQDLRVVLGVFAALTVALFVLSGLGGA